MKKRLPYLFLTIAISLSLVGCGSSAEATEQSSNQGNALESMFLSEDHFELRQESITIEYGTPLSQDLSQYVIAKDYEGIVCEYEEIFYGDALDGQSGTATFINKAGERLFMNVFYTDTTPPSIEQTEYTFCTIHSNGWIVEEKLSLFEDMGTIRYGGEDFNIDERVFNRDSLIDFFGITDNTTYINDSILIDDVLYNYEEHDWDYGWDRIPALDYGTHTVIFTGRDAGNNIVTFECILHIVADVSPEEREILISEYGYTEEQINAAVESFVNQE